MNMIENPTLFNGFQNRIIILKGAFQRKLWKKRRNPKVSFPQPVGNFVEKANAEIHLCFCLSFLFELL